MKLKIFNTEFIYEHPERPYQAPSNKGDIRWHLFIITFLLFFYLYGLYGKTEVYIPVQYKSEYTAKVSKLDLPDHNYFTSGFSGDLTWQLKNFKQALVLDMVTNDGMDIFHIGLLYLYVIVFYFMTRGGGNHIVFNNRVTTGFVYIALLSIITAFAEHSKYRFVDHYITQITGGQFELQPFNFPEMYFVYVGILLLFLQRFPQKAGELQKDQELTI